MRPPQKVQWHKAEWAIGVLDLPVSVWMREVLGGRDPHVEVNWFTGDRRGHWVADPIPFQLGSDLYVAYEVFDPWRGQGTLGVGILADGSIRHLGSPIEDRGRHFAYPFVTEYSGQLFCIPDSSYGVTTDLYRIDTPVRWERVGSLAGVPALTDPTIWKDSERLWLFGTTQIGSQEFFRVYTAPGLLEPWIEIQSPIPSDDRLRCAGPVVSVDGHLIRPSQDGRVRYGGGIHLNQLQVSSSGHIEERQVASFSPSGDWPFRHGAHTVSGIGPYTLIDAVNMQRFSAPIVEIHRLSAKYHRSRRRQRAAERGVIRLP